jgi:hypothetical protein
LSQELSSSNHSNLLRLSILRKMAHRFCYHELIPTWDLLPLGYTESKVYTKTYMKGFELFRAVMPRLLASTHTSSVIACSSAEQEKIDVTIMLTLIFLLHPYYEDTIRRTRREQWDREDPVVIIVGMLVAIASRQVASFTPFPFRNFQHIFTPPANSGGSTAILQKWIESYLAAKPQLLGYVPISLRRYIGREDSISPPPTRPCPIPDTFYPSHQCPIPVTDLSTTADDDWDVIELPSA